MTPRAVFGRAIGNGLPVVPAREFLGEDATDRLCQVLAKTRMAQALSLIHI